MNRPKISISIDLELLKRIDALAVSREESRSEVIERSIKMGMEPLEEFERSMENPLWRAAYLTLSKPGILMALAKVAGEDLTGIEKQDLHDRFAKHADRGKRRQSEKRGSGQLATSKGA